MDEKFRFLPTNQIWRYWGFDSFCSDMQKNNVHAVDLWLCNNHINVDAYDIYNLDAIQRFCMKSDIAVSTVTPEQSNPKPYNLCSLDTSIQKLTRKYYQNVVKIADCLGAQRISINSGWVPLDADKKRSYEQTVNQLRTICDMAESKGIKVVVEPLVQQPYRLFCTLGELAKLHEAVNSKNLFITLDTGTILRNGEDLSSWFTTFGTKISYVHLTNLNRKIPSHLSWADLDGELCLKSLLIALKGGSYSGDCALEMTRSTYFEHPDEELRKSLKLLKGCEG